MLGSVDTATGVHILGQGNAAAPATNANARGSPFWVDPTDWNVYGKNLSFQVTCAFATADGSWTKDIYASLYPVTGITGTASATTVVLGTEVPGSRTPTVTLAAADTVYPREESGEFTLTGAGLYVAAATIATALGSTQALLLSWSLITVSR